MFRYQLPDLYIISKPLTPHPLSPSRHQGLGLRTQENLISQLRITHHIPAHLPSHHHVQGIIRQIHSFFSKLASPLASQCKPCVYVVENETIMPIVRRTEAVLEFVQAGERGCRRNGLVYQ